MQDSTLEETKSSRFSVMSSYRRFPIKLMLLLAMLIAVFYAFCVSPAVDEVKSAAEFVGPKVGGKINGYRPRLVAKVTPDFLQRLIGIEYFQSVDSAYAHIYMDPSERQRHHPGQSLEMAIQCISHFPNIRTLHLSFSETDSRARQVRRRFDRRPALRLSFSGPVSRDTIDFSPLSRCKSLQQLDLHCTSPEIMEGICEHVNLRCLALDNVRLTNQMVSAITKNSQIESLQLNFCDITAEQIMSLSGMQNLRRVHFFMCMPIERDYWTFDFQAEHVSGGFALIDDNDIQMKARANEWLKKELKTVTISGLN